MFIQFGLDEVRLEDSDFAPRRARVKEYLLGFDLNRLLHTFRKQAGLPSSAEPLGGWEEETCGLRGHFTGHFLSACARFALGDQDPNMVERVESIVEVLSQCARPDGYLSAFEESVLDVLEAEENRNVWAPYYTLHKILQGLVDAHQYVGNGKALSLALNLAKYIQNRFQKLSFWKIDGMLRCTKVNPVNEFGGIGDTLYSLYEITGDPDLLELAKVFDRPYFIDNLAAGRDVLENLHANTHLPMILAAMHRYDLTGEMQYREAALHFLSFLVGRTFANGSNSTKATAFIPGQVSEKSEHWGAFGDLHDALTGGECESCCAHNTEKILALAFQRTGDVRWLEWLESLKYNAVLNSASAVTGLSQYHQPLGEGVVKKFSRPYEDFWCCTGSGIEAMSELQKNIWFHEGNVLLVNLPVSSTLHWKERGLQIAQQSDFPDQTVSVLTFHTAVSDPIVLRWKASSVQTVSLNGNPVPLVKENGFVSLRREFRKGDVVRVDHAATLVDLPLPGDDSRRALRFGPVLMAQTNAFAVHSDACADACGCPTEHQNRRLLPIFRIETEPYTVYSGETRSCTPLDERHGVKDGRAAYAGPG